ncbi:MAG: NACHT domain-containing protein, partial [Phycisphaerae bacterium]
MDPDGSQYEKILQPTCVATEAFWEIPCIALLGEPGIGKSTTINAAVDSVRNMAAANGDGFLDIDLRLYGSEDRLLSDISESARWKQWAAGTGTLHLFMDSMDECRLRISNIATLLCDLLRKNSSLLPRLRLRIACRTADWPDLLEKGLSDLFGKDNYQSYEFLPLRRRDVEELARDVGINPDAFMKAISSVDAQPLAIKPITLGLLINLFKHANALPKSKIDLYGRGCRQLCEETSDSRQAAGQVGKLDPDQRLALARRIAALIVFCNKSAISSTPTREVPQDDALALAELTGGVEPVRGNTIEVTEQSLREVLGTALFTGSGTGHVSFAHRTYAEFLAADYLRQHQVDQTQIASLVYHHGGADRRVVPQLSETAAWFAGMNSQFFRQILSTDPLLLLRSDAAALPDSDRAALLGAVLKKMEDGTANDSDYSLRRYYARFHHPELAAQLTPFITDKSKNDIVRRVAINVAKATHTLTLQAALLGASLDSTERHHVRDQASAALAEIGDDDHLRGLFPLLNLSGEEDPDDQLRGNAMRALWRGRLIDLEKLLSAIAPPREPDLWGSYSNFLEDELLQHLEIPAEIPMLLRWLTNHCERSADSSDTDYPELSDAAISEAWGHLDTPEVCEALGDYLLKLATETHTIFSSRAADSVRSRLDTDTGGRRRLALSIILREASSPETPSGWHWLSSVRIVQCSDLAWLLDQAKGVADAGAATRFANLAMSVFDGSDEPAKLDKLIDAAHAKPAIYKAFKLFIEPTDINSPQAFALRKQSGMMEKSRTRIAGANFGSLPTADDIRKLLDSFESGNIDVWWQLNRTLLLCRDGKLPGRGRLDYDLRKSPMWENTDEPMHARIVRAAVQYLRDGEPARDNWIAPDGFHAHLPAGFWAIILVYHADAEAFERLLPEVWKKWITAILEAPALLGISGESHAVYSITAHAYQKAPDEFIRILNGLIGKENEESGYSKLPILLRLRDCWDDRLCSVLMEKAKDVSLKPWAVGDLIEHLIEHDPGRGSGL